MRTMRTLLDPTSERAPVERQLAPRLPGLEGRRLGLLDISKRMGDVFLDRLAELLEAREVEVLRFRKPTYTKPAPPDLRREIGERCEAVVVALAD